MRGVGEDTRLPAVFRRVCFSTRSFEQDRDVC
jgi:hypothetical protein